MKKERKPESFLQRPVYPGGDKAMREFLGQQIRYPAAARQEKVEGTVRVRLTINYQGKVTRVKIITSLGYGCDEEAERVVRLLVFEVPKNRKVRATYDKTINIHFHYNEAAAKPVAAVAPVAPAVAQTMVYTVVPKAPVVKEPEKKPAQEKKPGYSYTINR
ncbi:MAG: hypothetical protein DA408_17875 [Bacteroidetes bacterium]|nr:MAG: hypothetical protein C7N36_06960 [Bacteroidota bacterium]PTM09672.1 MAG: hypothetical protein DA408_17875 [Bacteroidota bacterium]